MASELHVVFGSGGLALAVVRELATRGRDVRLSSRRPQVPSGVEVETVAGDASDPSWARLICTNAAVVYNCANAPYHQWKTKLAPLFLSILEGATAAGARLVVADNLYMYGMPNTPISESSPVTPVSGKGMIRAHLASQLLAADRSGKARVALCRGSDFFGPGITKSALGEQVFGAAVAGKTAYLLGNPDRLHSYTYIGDMARAMVAIGENEDTFGTVWHAPVAETVTTRQMAERIFAAAGRPLRTRSIGRGMIRLLGLFNQILRESVEMMYQFENNFVLDSAKFAARFGDRGTPLDDAISETVTWYRDEWQVAQLRQK